MKNQFNENKTNKNLELLVMEELDFLLEKQNIKKNEKMREEFVKSKKRVKYIKKLNYE